LPKNFFINNKIKSDDVKNACKQKATGSGGVKRPPPQSVEDLLMSVKKKCEMHFKKNK